MRYGYYKQRTVPYGNLNIEVYTKHDDEYVPTNEEVLSLSREIFGLPTREIYERLKVRLYWYQNIRLFENAFWDMMKRKNFKKHYDMDAYDVINVIQNAGVANGWLVTLGNSYIDKVYIVSLVKLVE